MNNFKDIHLIVRAEECPYWNYDNQTCVHTCGGCDDLRWGNTIRTIHCGIMIDGNRYCMLNCNVDGEIIESLKQEDLRKEIERLQDRIDDLEMEIEYHNDW